MKISDEIKEHSISEHIGQKEDYYEYIKESKEELVEEITKRIISEIKREKNNVINNIYVKEIEEEEEEEEVIDNKIQWAPIIVVILIGMFFLFILVLNLHFSMQAGVPVHVPHYGFPPGHATNRP